ncbi:unnamed protein product [Xyrichtys novacula]|uniref:Unnamed protein product n=1 Tax=Xyrichtys novacula TaxID=13765 RepID=A0AAV1FBV3_XYRNO|nr:unnamed protein product [Xyrichtys novacula]
MAAQCNKDHKLKLTFSKLQAHPFGMGIESKLLSWETRYRVITEKNRGTVCRNSSDHIFFDPLCCLEKSVFFFWLLCGLGAQRRARGECRNECEDPDAGDCALGVSAVFCQCWSHGLHGAWQRARRCAHSEKNGPAKPCKGWSDPQTGWLEEETPTATSFPQGAHAVLEQGTALSALPQVLISMLFLCLGGALRLKGPKLAQPEE